MGGAALLHVLAFLFTQWSIRFKAHAGYKRATGIENADAVLVVPEKFQGSMEITRMERRTLVRLMSVCWWASERLLVDDLVRLVVHCRGRA
jgi:manganese-transporting P-type ATPase